MQETSTKPQDCGVCPSCSVSEWRALDAAGQWRLTKARRKSSYIKGETLFHQNDGAHGIYCLESGMVLLRQFDNFGNETDFHVVMEKGTLGWRSYFAGQRHAATAVALTPCQACFISGRALEQIIHDYPPLALSFLRTVARDRGLADSLLLRSPLLPARIRAINLILIIAAQMGLEGRQGGKTFTLPISRHQIASMIGVRDETLSRTLATLVEQGMFEFEGRKVFIPRIERLYQEAHFELAS